MQELFALHSIVNEIKLLLDRTQTDQVLAEKIVSESSYSVKRNADEMLRQNHTSGIYKLLCEKIQHSEILMNENAHLKRTIYKYEVSLSEVNSALRKPISESELKKIISTQTKQIVSL